MYRSGNGFKNTSQRDFQLRKKRLMDTLLMKLRLKLVLNTFGYGLQLNQNIEKNSSD